MRRFPGNLAVIGNERIFVRVVRGVTLGLADARGFFIPLPRLLAAFQSSTAFPFPCCARRANAHRRAWLTVGMSTPDSMQRVANKWRKSW